MILKHSDLAYLIEMSVRISLDRLPPRREDVGEADPLWCPECEERVDPLAPDSHVVMQRPNGESLLLIACEGFHLFEVTR
jgi:hypothetical protein